MEIQNYIESIPDTIRLDLLKDCISIETSCNYMNIACLKIYNKGLSMDYVKNSILDWKDFTSVCKNELTIICEELDKLKDELYLYNFDWIDIEFAGLILLRIYFQQKREDESYNYPYKFIRFNINEYRSYLIAEHETIKETNNIRFFYKFMTISTLIGALILPNIKYLIY